MIELTGLKRNDEINDNDSVFSSKLSLFKYSSDFNEVIIPEYTPISDQKYSSSCVSQAIADGLETLLGVQQNKVVQLSRLFIYYNARVYDNAQNIDGGCFIRNAMDSIKRFGVCPESDWPFDLNNLFAQPTLDNYRVAIDNKIEDYYKINTKNQDRVFDIKSAIDNNHPVIFGTAVSKQFMNTFEPNKIWDFPNSAIAGDHAMCIVGYKIQNNSYQFKIRNSWGSGWGDNGYTWFSEDYIKSPWTFDMWIPTLVPSLLF